jgi:hypothetical protein
MAIFLQTHLVTQNYYYVFLNRTKISKFPSSKYVESFYWDYGTSVHHTSA